MRGILLGVCGAAALASGAHASLFSFASDTDHTSSTFGGAGQFLSDANDSTDRVTLLIDDDNGPLPALAFAGLEFQFSGRLTYVASVAMGGGRFLHTYNIDGLQGGPATFGFFNPNGTPVLTATFEGGVFAAQGGAADWGSAAGIQAGDITGQVTYTWHGATNAAYGLFSGQSSIGLDDAAFTLTFLNTAGVPGAPLGAAAPYPTSEWRSEGSYSGSARFVPSPGALTLAGLGAAFLARRRR
jgi:MYXO-CTERM domain-containing protein